MEIQVILVFVLSDHEQLVKDLFQANFIHEFVEFNLFAGL
jgi:hypothetical protein